MDDALDELYAADPGEFVARRDALARELRQGGDREAASRVKELRRPSRAAWLLNRLARDRRAELRAVLDAGRELAAAQDAAVAGRGGGGDALRGAQRALRAAIDGLVTEAAGGESGATVEKVRGTLQAAAADDELRAAVAAGWLDREASPAGFGGLGAGAPVAPKDRAKGKPRAKPKPKTKAKAGGRMEAGTTRDETAARRREEEAARKAEAEEAARREREARRRRELRAAKEAEAAAAHELEAAQAALRQVEAALSQRREEAARAQERADQARQRRERLERDD